MIDSRELVDHIRREAVRDQEPVDIPLAGRKAPNELDRPERCIARILLRRFRTRVLIAYVAQNDPICVQPSLDELEESSEEPFGTSLDANLDRFHFRPFATRSCKLAFAHRARPATAPTRTPFSERNTSTSACRIVLSPSPEAQPTQSGTMFSASFMSRLSTAFLVESLSDFTFSATMRGLPI